MLPYTEDYIEHNDDNIDDFKYYTFTPRPLMHGDMYKMDLVQMNLKERNRIWEYMSLKNCMVPEL